LIFGVWSGIIGVSDEHIRGEVMENIYNSKEYRCSRLGYWLGTAFDYLFSQLMGDAFLAKVLTYIGIGDATIGVITSLQSLMCTFSLFSLILVRHITGTKKPILFLKSSRMTLCLFVYLIPFLNLGVQIKTILVAGAMMLLAVVYNIASPILYAWGTGNFDPQNRARSEALTSIVSLVFGIVFSLTVGVVVDRYDHANNTAGGMIFLIVVMLVLMILNLASTMMIQEAPPKQERQEKLFDSLKFTLTDPGSRSMTIFMGFRSVASGVLGGFIGVYKIKELALSMGAIQVINVFSWLLPIFASFPLARWADRRENYTKAAELGSILFMISFFVAIFVMPETAWLIFIYSGCLEIASITTYSGPLYYNLVGPERLVSTMTISGLFQNLILFLSGLIGAAVVSAVQGRGSVIFGVRIYAQQLLAAIAFIFAMLAYVYLKKVVQKQKIISR